MMLLLAPLQDCSAFPSYRVPRIARSSKFLGQMETFSSTPCRASAAWLPIHPSSILISGSRPFKFRRLSGMGSLKMLATSEEKSTSDALIESEKGGSSASDKKAAERAAVKKGQATAIVTGTIAVLLGVGYLILVQLLDSRGVNLLPPPPEAFDP